MKKLVTVLLIGGMLVCFAGCSKKEENPIGNMPNPFYKEETEGDQMNTQIPNPWIEVETMEEAVEKAGFDFVVEPTIGNMTIKSIRVIEGKMISIDYEGDGQTATIRKSNEIGDISGDYNDYGKEETNTTESGIEYTYKVRTTIWMNDDYSYSATFNYDVTTDEVISLMKTLK